MCFNRASDQVSGTPILDKNREIVLICHHGIRSYQVARVLEHNGFYRVINLDDGLERWTQDLDPGIARY